MKVICGLFGLFVLYPLMMFWVIGQFGPVAWFVVIPIGALLLLALVSPLMWAWLRPKPDDHSGNLTDGSA